MDTLAAGMKVNLIGAFGNLTLFCLELCGLYLYCKSEPSARDWKLFHCVLVVSLLSDTLATMVICGISYLNFTILSSGGAVFPAAWVKFFLIWIATNMISAFNFQFFMCFRYMRLSGNRIITAFIVVCILTSMAATLRALAFGDSLITTILSPDRVESSSTKFILIVLATAMATDITITGALVHHLYKSKDQATAQTNKLISRLLVHFIKTGAVPCLFATIILVLYVASSDAGASIAFALCLGRIYTSTMLFTLLFRSRVAQDKTLRPSVINISRSTETHPTSIALADVTSSQMARAPSPADDKKRFDIENQGHCHD